jgi:hypothetical protein
MEFPIYLSSPIPNLSHLSFEIPNPKGCATQFKSLSHPPKGFATRHPRKASAECQRVRHPPGPSISLPFIRSMATNHLPFLEFDRRRIWECFSGGGTLAFVGVLAEALSLSADGTGLSSACPSSLSHRSSFDPCPRGLIRAMND